MCGRFKRERIPPVPPINQTAARVQTRETLCTMITTIGIYLRLQLFTIFELFGNETYNTENRYF